jgi:2-methylcitrate dehydratase PrpD
MGIAFKPHASCRVLHAHVDAAISLKQQHNLQLTDVESVDVLLSKAGIVAVGTPDKRTPQTVLDAQFSAPFGVAVALKLGRQSWDDYETQMPAQDVRDLMQRTNSVFSPEAEAIHHQWPGGVTLHLKDGRTVTEFVPVPSGEPSRMLTQDQIREKFLSLTGPYVKDGEGFFEAILALDIQPSGPAVFDAAAQPLAV